LAAAEDLVDPGGVVVRLYLPTFEPRPLVAFLHGGMWTIGDLDSHDRACRKLSASAQVAILAVDFWQAPRTRCQQPSRTYEAGRSAAAQSSDWRSEWPGVM
jgi:acetyl esterase